MADWATPTASWIGGISLVIVIVGLIMIFAYDMSDQWYVPVAGVVGFILAGAVYYQFGAEKTATSPYETPTRSKYGPI